MPRLLVRFVLLLLAFLTFESGPAGASVEWSAGDMVRGMPADGGAPAAEARRARQDARQDAQEGARDGARDGAGEAGLLPDGEVNYGLKVNAPDEIVALVTRHTLAGRWQRRSDYDPDQFPVLLRRLREETIGLLAAEGWFSPEVEVSSEQGEMRVEVATGPRATVARVDLIFTGALLESGETEDEDRQTRLVQEWKLSEGSFFISDDWQAAKRSLLNALQAERFPRARIVRSEARVDAERSAVELQVEIDSGPPIAFGEFHIKGLKRYDPRIVEALQRIRPGDPYSMNVLLDFQKRLQDSGYFSGATVLPDLALLEQQPDALQVPVNIDLVEYQRRRIGLGLGFTSDAKGPRGEIDYTDRNLFERGWQLSTGALIEPIRRRVYGQIGTPYDEQGRNYMGGMRYERADIQNQLTDKYTWFLGRNRRTTSIDYFLSVQYQLEQALTGQSLQVASQSEATTLGYSWTWRRTDSRLFPTQGFNINSQISVASDRIASTRSFVRSYLKTQYFLPVQWAELGRRHLLFVSAEGGAVAAEARDGIPSDNLFRAGGAQSLRGYDFQSLGVRVGDAVVGARFLAIGSVEYQHTLTDLLRAAVFVDAGNAFDNIDTARGVVGYGAGVRIRTPVGPINFDAAWSHRDQKFRLHLSIGYTF